METLLLIIISSAIVNNVVLSQFLGLCPFLGVSKKVDTALGMGVAVIFVITISAFITSLIYKFILVTLGLEYLQTIVFILVIAALVQFVEMFLKKSVPSLYEALGVYLPLITTNCAVLGVALNSVTYGYNILESHHLRFWYFLRFYHFYRDSGRYPGEDGIQRDLCFMERYADRTRDSGTDVHRVFRIFRYHLTGGKRCGSYRRSKCVGKGEKMSVTGIILAAAVVGGTGLVISILLGIASEKFKVPVDEKEIAVRECLPGNNCGGCGFAGCDALAKAIAQGEAPVSACPVGGSAVAAKIGEIMGVETGDMEKMVAFVKCAGTCEKASSKYKYFGNEDCVSAISVPGGGPKACEYGCTGFGSCVKVCDFDAIHIVNGIALVDKEKCVACGKCVSVCPKSLIELVPYKAEHKVACNSKAFGKAVKEVCAAGCIGCKLCVKTCEDGAITVENNIAHIDYSKCTGCGKCAEKCPAKVIL